MVILTVTEARSKLEKLLDDAAESHEPILIAGERTNAVLISPEIPCVLLAKLTDHSFRGNTRAKTCLPGTAVKEQ